MDGGGHAQPVRDRKTGRRVAPTPFSPYLSTRRSCHYRADGSGRDLYAPPFVAVVILLSHMIRVVIAVEAFEAIARTLPLGSLAYEPEPNAKGERSVWIDGRQADKLAAMRGQGESYSDVILRLAKMEAGS
jgi:hypothetical protein